MKVCFIYIICPPPTPRFSFSFEAATLAVASALLTYQVSLAWCALSCLQWGSSLTQVLIIMAPTSFIAIIITSI